MICCLNPDCQNPPHADGTNFCTKCGTRMALPQNRYRPLKSIGGDGPSKTYLAEDIAKEGEQGELCIIQQLALRVREAEERHLAKERFEKKARRMQELGERSEIPGVLAYFEERESLYLVQDYIQGPTVRDRLKQQGIFSETQVRQLWRDLLNILKIAHDRHTIHGDIKPENIILTHPPTPLPGGGELTDPTPLSGEEAGGWVLVGFDLGKPTLSTLPSSSLPAMDPTVGEHLDNLARSSRDYPNASPLPNYPALTPLQAKSAFGYRAMELQEGETAPASDLYSLGCVGFYLLTGVDPLELWRRQGYAWASRWREHLGQPASDRLAGILDKLLEPKLALRYQSVEEVLADLDIEPQAEQVIKEESEDLSPSPEAPTAEPIARATAAATAEPAAATTPVDVAISPVEPSEGEISEESQYWAIAPGKSEDLKKESASRGRRKVKLKRRLVAAIAVLASGGLAVAAIGELSRRGAIAVFGESQTTSSQKAAIANTLTAHADAVNAVGITPDGQTLVSASRDNTIGIWNLDTGELLRTLTGHTYLLNCLAMSYDGKIIASGGFDKTIRIWNLDTGELMQTISRNSVGIDSLAISPDGETVAAGSSRHIKIWNAKTGRLQGTLIAHKSWVAALGISPDGQTLVSGSLDGTIKLWNLPAGKLSTTLSGKIEAINSLAISPDGEILAAGGVSGKIEIWHLPTGKLQRTLAAHTGAVNSLTASADGKTLISGGRDSAIKIWNPKTGKLALAIASQNDGVNSVAISPDGRTLASGTGDKTIQIWQLQ